MRIGARWRASSAHICGMDAGHIVPRGGLGGWMVLIEAHADMKLVEWRGRNDQINRG